MLGLLWCFCLLWKQKAKGNRVRRQKMAVMRFTPIHDQMTWNVNSLERCSSRYTDQWTSRSGGCYGTSEIMFLYRGSDVMCGDETSHTERWECNVTEIMTDYSHISFNADKSISKGVSLAHSPNFSPAPSLADIMKK